MKTLTSDTTTIIWGYQLNVPQLDEDEYYRQLRERQKQHLENVERSLNTHKTPFRPCMHDQCTQCQGTGKKLDGSMCIHMISCPCPKCTPYFM